ncbi:MAG: hypothetical protein R3E99_17490 [Burkholderiaceae bacterium]
MNTSTFDSGALGPLAMVVHNFAETGRYSAIIQRNGRPVGETAFTVDKASDAMQLDIDLSAFGSAHSARPDGKDCACHGQGDAEATPRVSPQGHVLFHAGQGSGYAVTVVNSHGKAVFDSTRLEDGDLFALSLLEPTAYRLENTVSGAKGQIQVAFDESTARNIRSLPTQYVEAQGKSFSSSQIALASTQGLVFRIKDPARIVIAREGGERPVRGQPVLRWQKPSPAHKPATSAR